MKKTIYIVVFLLNFVPGFLYADSIYLSEEKLNDYKISISYELTSIPSNIYSVDIRGPLLFKDKEFLMFQLICNNDEHGFDLICPIRTEKTKDGFKATFSINKNFIENVLISLDYNGDNLKFKLSDDPVKQANTSVTLQNLFYVEPSSSITQYPLVCGAGRDFPSGRELEFRNSETRESVHAVFPEGHKAPVNLNGSFIVHGFFQSIQNKDSYKFKKLENDYRYFVVSAWEYDK